MNGIIYCYTNLITGKKYVGQTIDPEGRMANHKSEAFNPKNPLYDNPLPRAIRKYGWKNFQYEVLEKDIDNFETLNQKEIEYIAQFNCQTPNGYNIEPGGKNSAKPKSDETKEKLMRSRMVLSEEEVIELRKAYANNESPSKIYREKYADKMHYNSFLNIWSGRKYKYIMPEVLKVGRHTKLTAEKVRDIKIKYKSGKYTYDELASMYDVSKSTIADIMHERSWKHVQI